APSAVALRATGSTTRRRHDASARPGPRQPSATSSSAGGVCLAAASAGSARSPSHERGPTRMPTMEQLLREAVEKNASDLHLSAGQPPRLRVDGDLAPLDHPVQTPEDVMACVETVLSAEQKAKFQ